MGIFLGILFYRRRSTTIGVALPQHRIHCAASRNSEIWGVTKLAILKRFGPGSNQPKDPGAIDIGKMGIPLFPLHSTTPGIFGMDDRTVRFRPHDHSLLGKTVEEQSTGL